MFKFKSIFEQRQQLLRNEPEKAQAEARASSHLVSNFESRVKVRGFEVVVDQPKGMGSGDKAPRPSEYVLAALAACHEVTYRLYADALEIPLNDISVDVVGLSDAKGFFNLDDNARAGFTEIYGTINIDSPACNEDIERLRQMVNKHCPVLDDLRTPIPVELEVKRVEQ